MNKLTGSSTNSFPHTLADVTADWLVSSSRPRPPCAPHHSVLYAPGTCATLTGAGRVGACGRAAQTSALGSPVESFDTHVCEEGQLGFTLLILNIKYTKPAEEKPSSVCLKCACIGDDMRGLTTAWGTNSKEINCYLNLRDDIPMTMPKPLAICAHIVSPLLLLAIPDEHAFLLP
eukprot:COSAG01_NODE_8611_length_2720_cov_1.495612_3_plen_175_part_00